MPRPGSPSTTTFSPATRPPSTAISITVSAEVHGLKDGEPVLLHFSTADGQVLDQTLPHDAGKGQVSPRRPASAGQLGTPARSYLLPQRRRFPHRERSTSKCKFRRRSSSIGSNIIIRNTPACPTAPSRAKAISARSKARKSTIHAEANQPIRRANLDLNCLGNLVRPMIAKDKTATGQLTLKMKADDPTKPEFESYQIRFTDAKDRDEPPADSAPHRSLARPAAGSGDRRTGEGGNHRGRRRQAGDSRARVGPRFRAPPRGDRTRNATAGSSILPPILDLKAPQPPKTGEFVGPASSSSRRSWDLKGGDRVEFWAEADDNKEPTANRSTTAKKTIVIVSPENRNQNNKQPRLATTR